MRNFQHVPFFGRPGFFPSPPKSFHLPVYAEALSRDFVAMDPNPTSRVRSVQPRALEFIDDYAIETDLDSSATEDSSTSNSSI